MAAQWSAPQPFSTLLKLPAGLTGVRHVIKSTDAAGSFSSVENGWGADHCAAMLVGADAGSGREYYAVRQS